jgi:hypothetical protein
LKVIKKLNKSYSSLRIYVIYIYNGYIMSLMHIPDAADLSTVKPVLRGHLWGKENVILYKKGDLLKEV